MITTARERRQDIGQTTEEFDDEPIIPKRIGFCTNWISSHDICGREITDQDVLAVELPKNGKRRVFCCGPCVSRLISPRPEIDLQDKIVKKKKFHRGINGNGGAPKAKQPKYVKDYE